jgi:formate-dependent nitrite reductase membrane component NrfD
MLIVSAIADLFFHNGDAFSLGTLVATVVIAVGSGLLIFDLGRRIYFWRVFSRQKSILTAGAWMLSLAVICGLVYSSTLIDFSPFYGLDALRSACAWICLLLGMGVTIYTGVFLGTIKARPFWNSAALPILFFISAVSNGLAAQSLLINFRASDIASITRFMQNTDIVLILLEIIILMVYVLIMRYSSTVSAAKIASTWLSGTKKVAFWVGMVFLGLVLPVLFYLVDSSATLIIAAALALVGGIILRFLVVYTDNRVILPGEEQFLRWLPEGDEEFIHAWEEE